jgi:phosphoesterase RecJ-like protein
LGQNYYLLQVRFTRQEFALVPVNLWHDVIAVIKNNQSFIITSHSNPDCDAIGSELALAKHLQNIKKKAVIINSDPVPASFRFLDPKSSKIVKIYSANKHASIINKAGVIIVLDASGGWARTGRAGQAFEQTQAIKVCIDHHPDSTDFVDIAVIDTDAAATAELIYNLITMMNGQLNPMMAQALYTAILTDTGSFRFPKTSVQTHRIAAELVAAGADPSHIYRHIYEQYPLSYVRLKGHVIDSIKTEAAGQIAYYSLTQETLKAYGIKAADLDGFASLGQEVGGVRVTIFCLELPKKIKISLRSDGTVPINQIALEYKGGGHPSAAGATVADKSLDEVMAELIEKAKQLFEFEH